MKTARFAAALGSSMAFVFFPGDADAGGRLDTGAVQAGNEKPADIVAVKIRKQGYSCDTPLGVERDHERSMPNQPVWILKCGNATYRVRLVPDMAAHVERLD
jgi:hypothetical protein